MNNYNLEIKRELKEIENDKLKYKTELESERNRLSILLKGDMGKDIHNVLEGKVKIKIPFTEKIKFKINYFLNKLFNTI